MNLTPLIEQPNGFHNCRTWAVYEKMSPEALIHAKTSKQQRQKTHEVIRNDKNHGVTPLERSWRTHHDDNHMSRMSTGDN